MSSRTKKPTGPRRKGRAPYQNVRPGEEVHLYAFKCEDCFKVGTARDPRRRLTELQVGSPFKITGRYYVKVPLELAALVEGTAFEILADYHVRGEWFRCSTNTVKAALARADAVVREAIEELRPREPVVIPCRTEFFEGLLDAARVKQ